MNTARDVQVRRATAADADDLARLRYAFRSSIATPAETGAEFVARCAVWMREHLADDRRWRAFALEHAGAVVGNIWLQLVEKLPNPVVEPELHGYVTNLFVLPPYRNAGAGSRLLAALLSECDTLGTDEIFLWPTPPSRALYERHGFSSENTIMVRGR